MRHHEYVQALPQNPCSQVVVALIALALFSLSSGSPLSAQRRGIPAAPLPEGQTNDPFPQPIARDEGVISNGVQAWIPFALAPQWPTRPSLDTGWLTVVGRVKAGLTMTDVERQLTVSAARIAASQPTTRANAAPRVRPHGYPPNDCFASPMDRVPRGRFATFVSWASSRTTRFVRPSRGRTR